MNHTFCTHKGYNTVVSCDDSCPSLQKEKKKVENREEFENDCCDKCHDVTFEKTYPAHTAYHACMDLKCKCHSLQKESEWDENLKKSFLKELDFLSDHWVNGDDKPPFSFGGWREEVANEFVKIAKTAVSNREKEIAEEVEKMREVCHEPTNDSVENARREKWNLIITGKNLVVDRVLSIINKHQ